jgi:DNA-binding MarR family transcriptional regulator
VTTADSLFDALEEFFGRCLGMAESESVDVLVELDLSLSQAKMVFVLAHAAEAMPINRLADHVHLSVAATGRNVDQLVRAGLAERHESEADRRVKLVTITEAGRAAADHHIEAKREALRQFIGRLDAAQADTLRAALTPILAGDALRPIHQETSV